MSTSNDPHVSYVPMIVIMMEMRCCDTSDIKFRFKIYNVWGIYVRVDFLHKV